ncbi:MAG: cytochrome c biogenesis protein CcsA [Desulfobulbaceae bacterium]
MTFAHYYWLSLALYITAGVFFLAGLVFVKKDAGRAGSVLAATGLLMHTVSLGQRWLQTGHGPYVSTYEILSSNTWIVVLFFLLLQARLPRLRNLGAVVMPLAFLMMGFALVGSTEARTLSPTLLSGWLVVHIIFAKLTVAALIVAVSLSVVYLLRATGREVKKILRYELPRGELLLDYAYRFVAFGFVTMTIMIVTGAIWADTSWGSYWAWRPTETWSLGVWLAYGVFLHGRVTFNWSGRVVSWYVILAFLFSILAFFVLPFLVKGIHSQYMVG